MCNIATRKCLVYSTKKREKERNICRKIILVFWWPTLKLSFFSLMVVPRGFPPGYRLLQEREIEKGEHKMLDSRSTNPFAFVDFCLLCSCHRSYLPAVSLFSIPSWTALSFFTFSFLSLSLSLLVPHTHTPCVILLCWRLQQQQVVVGG